MLTYLGGHDVFMLLTVVPAFGAILGAVVYGLYHLIMKAFETNQALTVCLLVGAVGLSVVMAYLIAVDNRRLSRP